MGKDMTDELQRRVRFKLGRDRHNWIVMRSYITQKETEIAPKELWKQESYHMTMRHAALHMLERLIAEGYKPKGLEALVARVEEAEKRVMDFCEAYCADVEAEVEVLP